MLDTTAMTSYLAMSSELVNQQEARMLATRRNKVLVTAAATLIAVALVAGASAGAAATATVVAYLALHAGWTRRADG